MKTLITIILAIILTGCAGFDTRQNRYPTRPYTPSETGLAYGLMGAGIGVALGSMLDTGIDQKYQDYGNYTRSGRWNDKSINGKHERKGGYSVSGGHNNVRRYTTKNHKGNNMAGMALQLFQIGARYGRQIGLEQQTQRLQEENNRLRQQLLNR